MMISENLYDMSRYFCMDHQQKKSVVSIYDAICVHNMIIYLWIRFCTWKPVATTVNSAVESVRDLERAMINFHHWIVLYLFIVTNIVHVLVLGHGGAAYDLIRLWILP